MVVELGWRGLKTNRKAVQRMMREMGLEAVGPKPNLSTPHPQHERHPYLLRNVPIVQRDQVWSSDITYIRLRHGFVYLTAVMDWYSRYVLSWRLSNTLEAAFCIDALMEALDRGQPLIFNTDQGSQFTCCAFLEPLKQRDISISMDGRGRALDNVWIERLWRSVKYEDVFLRDYESLADVRCGLTNYFKYYNTRRPHQSLGYRPPVEFYR